MSSARILPSLFRRAQTAPLSIVRNSPVARQQSVRPSLFAQNQFTHPSTTTQRLASTTMSALKAGDSFPQGTAFSYIPWTKEIDNFTSCGIPQNYDASKEWADKKVVLVSIPGAFTPTCSANHLPGYINKLEELKAKGVDIVAFIAYNDAFVMSAWGKANSVTGNDLVFLSDPEAKFSKSIGWTAGERTARYAIVIDHGKVVYAEKEAGPGLDVSGAEAVLKQL